MATVVRKPVYEIEDPTAFDENAFQSWYGSHAKTLGLNPNPDDPRHFYDYRAAYQAGAEPVSDGHWPSQFKLEGHPRTIIDGVNTKTGEPASSSYQIESPDDETIRGVSKTPIQSLAETGAKASARVVTLPLVNPISNRLEQAGEKVNASVQDVAGRIAEAQHPNIAAILSLASEIGKLTPSNLALNVGGQAAAELPLVAKLPLPFAGKTIPEVISKVGGKVDDVLGIPFVKRSAEKLVAGIKPNIEQKLGMVAERAAKAGKTVSESFTRTFETAKKVFDDMVESANRSAKDAAETAASARQRGLVKRFEDMAERYGGEPIGLQEAGRKIQTGFAGRLSSLRSKGDQLYKKLGEVSANQKASNQSDALEFIDSVFGEQGIVFSQSRKSIERMMSDLDARDLLGRYSPQEIVTMGQRLERASTGGLVAELESTKLAAYKKMADVMNDLAKPDLTGKELAQIRTEVGRFAYSGMDDPIKGVYRGLYRKLTNDLERTATEGGYSKLSSGARSVWKKYRDLEESDIAKVTEGVPEEIVTKMAKANSPTRIEELFKNIDPSAQRSFRRAFMDHVLEKSGGDPGLIRRQLATRTEETKRAIFGGDFDLVKRYENLVKILSESKTLVPKKTQISETMFSDPAFSPLEGKIYNTVKNADFSRTIDVIVANGKDESRIDAIFKIMNEPGKTAFRRGLLDRIFEDPKTLTKMDDLVLKKIYGDDYKALSAYKNVLNAKDSLLKTGFIEDILNTITFFYPPRALRGTRGLVSKYKFAGQTKEAKSVFPELAGGGIRKFVSTAISPRVAKAAARSAPPITVLKESEK